MTTHDALLAAIIATPADDLPRLVYADWLDENGQPERAEFIRVQIELAKVDKPGVFWGRRELYLHGRQHKLIHQPGHGWPHQHGVTGCWFPIVGWYCNFVSDGPTLTLINEQSPDTHGEVELVIRRGFVAEVRCTLAEWCGGECRNCEGQRVWVLSDPCPNCYNAGRTPSIGPAVVAAHPVERVELTDREPHRNPVGLFLFNRVDGVPEHAAEVPAAVFDMMDGLPVERPTSRAHTVKYYPTRELAISALSSAIIAWAKDQNQPRIVASPVSVDFLMPSG